MNPPRSDSRLGDRLSPPRFGSETAAPNPLGSGATGCESSGEESRVNIERCFEGERLGVNAFSPFSVIARRRDGLLSGGANMG